MTIQNAEFETRATAKYENVRPKIKSGDLLLCSGRAVFSKLIQKATNSPLSHVGFVIRAKESDRVMVMESVESQGVRTVPLSHYRRDYGGKGKPYKGKVYIARHAGMTARVKNQPKHLQAMVQMAVDRFGYPYDRDEIVKIAGRIGLGIFGIKSSASLKDDREYICSEYVWLVYRQIGIEILNKTRGFIAPADFAADPDVKLMWQIL